MDTATLGNYQQAFMAFLLDDTLPLPQGWEENRIAIYRNAYRARLVDALRETYPRTARWVGEAAFQQAAVHHVISHPPRSWTLDTIGERFEDTVAGLFLKDREVSELAWLEWAMHRCFVSADAATLDASGFGAATAHFGDDDWARLRLHFLPGTQQAPLVHRADLLWRALGDNDAAELDYSSDEPLACIVWRQDLKPVFLPVEATEGRAMAMMLAGASYGELCEALVDELGEDAAVSEAGAMLGRWLQHGMIAGVSLSA